jgi:peptide/nickel transport system permease protein
MSVAPTPSAVVPVGVPAAMPEEASRPELARRFFLGSRLAACATAVLAALLAVAVLGPLVWHADPTAVSIGDSLQAPSSSHPMGTDANGRDILARFQRGAQLSLLVASIATLVGAVLGGMLGVLCGVVGGWLDAVVMRVMDAILAFPPLILAMAVTVGLGAGVKTATVGIILTSIPWYARLLRSEALSLRSRQFIEAARALGADRRRVVLRHVVPHVMPTLAIQAASVFGYAILTLAALGFVGLGAQPPTAEWGAMITDGLQYAITGQWWVGFFPGVGIFLAVTVANVLADRALEVLDPRAQGRG